MQKKFGELQKNYVIGSFNLFVSHSSVVSQAFLAWLHGKTCFSIYVAYVKALSKYLFIQFFPMQVSKFSTMRAQLGYVASIATGVTDNLLSAVSSFDSGLLSLHQ